MSDKLKQLLTTLAGYPVLWLFSALLHAVDGRIEGFLPLLTMYSVYALAATLFIPCLIALIGFWSRGAKIYWSVMIGSAILVGLLLTLGGSSASDFVGYAISFLGATSICALFLIPGTLPGVLFLKKNRDKL